MSGELPVRPDDVVDVDEDDIRYAAIEVLEEIVIYDREQTRAWIQSDTHIGMEACR